VRSAPRIRPATPADLGFLVASALALAAETEDKGLDPTTVRAGIAAGLADPARARYFVAMQDAATAGSETIGTAVGTLMLTREWSDWRNGDWWWIQSVYVAPAQRRHGIFSALYRHVEALARATPGVVGLRLYVEHGNAAALETYAALGLRDAGYRMLEAPFG
jgi:ribosomal protein S18 acetylase RimI-like enzyme